MKVSVSNLSKAFEDGRIILDNIHLTDDIHTLAIIGPSGGGKSTFLRILGGLIPPTDGELFIGGQKVHYDMNSLHTYRKEIGFVFQQGGLFKHMSALQNIALPLTKVHNFHAESAHNRAMELLIKFGLEDDCHKKPSSLSGGQQQRIAIARAIAPKPKIILLDEPTSALDPEYTNDVLDMINDLKSEGMDFIIVTHEMGFARHACDKIAFLYNGKLLEYGPSTTLFSNPQTNELSKFLGKLLEWNI